MKFSFNVTDENNVPTDSHVLMSGVGSVPAQSVHNIHNEAK
jgi:hypothetical protein